MDLGPGNTLGKLIGNVVQGTGIGVVEATTLSERSTPPRWKASLSATQNWKVFALRVINLPRPAPSWSPSSLKLTGKPPVLLPGTTPTTVEPEIVAAAGNAGYWAELPAAAR